MIEKKERRSKKINIEIYKWIINYFGNKFYNKFSTIRNLIISFIQFIFIFI